MSDAECETLRRELLDGSDFGNIETEKLERMCTYLREYSSELIAKREYEKAKETNDLYACLKEELKERREEFLRQNDRGTSYEQMKAKKEEDNKRQLQEFEDKWKARENEMMKEQKKKLDDFEEKWKTVYPQKYRKQSEKLIHLQELEKKAGIAADLDEAVRLREEVKKLEKEEMEKAQEQLIRDYTLARSKLDAEQKEERDLFESTRKHWREVIVARQKQEMESIKKREVVLNVKKERLHRQVATSFDIMGRERQEAVVHRDRGSFNKEHDKLLPPLIPPNDRRIKERRQQMLKQRKEQQERFRQHIEERDREGDRSAPSSSRDSEARPRTMAGTRRTPSRRRQSTASGVGESGSGVPMDEQEKASSRSTARDSSAREDASEKEVPNPEGEKSARSEKGSGSEKESARSQNDSGSEKKSARSENEEKNSGNENKSARSEKEFGNEKESARSEKEEKSPENENQDAAGVNEQEVAPVSTGEQPRAFLDIVREVYIPKDCPDDADAKPGQEEQVNFV